MDHVCRIAVDAVRSEVYFVRGGVRCAFGYTLGRRHDDRWRECLRGGVVDTLSLAALAARQGNLDVPGYTASDTIHGRPVGRHLPR